MNTKLTLGVVALIIVGAGVWLYYQQPAMPTSYPPVATGTTTSTTKTATAADTSNQDWKTYTNTQYGFLLKYPSDGTVDANSPPWLWGFTLAGGNSMSIEVNDTVFDPNNVQDLYGKVETKKITVAGHDAYSYSVGDAGCSSERVKMALGQKTLVIAFGQCEGDKPPYLDSALQGKILSTFSFK